MLACTVLMDPSTPVFIACSMSRASAPRHSPTMMRSGRMRRAVRSRMRWLMPPSLFRFGGRVSNLMTWRCWSCNSAVSSMVMMRSSSGMNRESALSMVVLPEPVPPEISTVILHCTQRREEPQHAGRDRLVLHHFLLRDDVAAEAADAEAGAVERQRRNDGVDARAVLQARVHDRLRFIDAAAHLRDDLFDDVQQVRVVLEAHRGLGELAVALDEYLVVAVDQDVARCWAL